ncbi:ABC transporter permease [Plantactinospora sp. KBS50]|uniref:ABC transporter permease n=1 Tax=Plantactinospora sp. KBS50 TaxID=2024580 RepID=UPI000BAAF314|nr:ABC transporter permease [Plantactinospora sp. KBS50]ASW56557.1 ABC transporter permease [Plantactinospora sp. KBS50]
MRLVRSELLKIRTTSVWWIFALITLPLWGLTLFINYIQASFYLNPTIPQDQISPDQQAQIAAAGDPVNVAASFYTNGQLLSLMIIMLLGIIVVTSEFFHQTVTTTFLTTPHRTAVVLAKLAAGALLGLAFWIVTTVLNIATGGLILGHFGLGSQLGEGAVWQAIGLNGLAYLLWTAIGVGLGVLIRSQIGATVTGIMLYLGGYIGALIVIGVLANRFGDWINKLQLIVPSLASQLMVTGTNLPGNPPRWAGAAVLIGYAVVAGVIGTLIMRRRDVS